MNLRRNGLHAAPLHESLPVAWRRLVINARALSRPRPGTRPADAGTEGPATPLAGQGAAPAETPVQAGAVPLIDTTLLARPRNGIYRGTQPRLTTDAGYALNRPLYDTGGLPVATAEAMRALDAAPEHSEEWFIS